MKRPFLLWVALGLVALQACREEMPVVVDSGTCSVRDDSSLTWTLMDNGTLTISGEGEIAYYDNPSHMNPDLPPWYDYREDIKRVVIDEGVTGIGDYAFSEHTNLALVTISGSVTYVKNEAFFGCCRLTAIQVDDANPDYCSQGGVLFSKDKTVLCTCPGGLRGEYTIPEGVTDIQEKAFYRCAGLTAVAIPDAVTSIGHSAFKNCTALTSVNIPDGVTSIETYTFSDCSSLTSVNIPDGVTSIGEYAFSDCTSLTSVTIPNGVTSIEKGTFSGCVGLTSVDIPDGVISIGNYVFSDCTNLTSLDIPDGVISIGNYVFSDCTNLTSLDIPDGVTSIGKGAFSDCTSLASLDIPDGVTSIGGEAFYACTSLTSVNIPNGVTSIEDDTFDGCTSLASITIPDGVTGIGEYAFRGCASLTSMTIPDGVESIEYGAFNGCTRLATIALPESVTSVGGAVFDGTAFYNDESNWADGVLYINRCLIKVNREKVTGTGTYAIKPGTRAIAGGAFKYCDLTAVTIPEGVVSIGASAFSFCQRLASVTIPSSVTNIGGYAFASCTSLASITSYAVMPPNLVSDTFYMVDRSILVYVPEGSVGYYQSHPYWGEFTIQPIQE